MHTLNIHRYLHIENVMLRLLPLSTPLHVWHPLVYHNDRSKYVLTYTKVGLSLSSKL